jgi:multiple sugar transport system substrate-binding protein
MAAISNNGDGIRRLGKPLSRRAVVKAATGAAAGFSAWGVVGKSYQRALAQDSIKDQILKIPGKLEIGQSPTDEDMERVGELTLHTQKKGAFQGQTLTVMGNINANLHNVVFRPLSRAWEEATGATIEWIDLTQAEHYPRFAQSLASGNIDFDVLEGGAPWEGQLLGGDWALPMPDAIKSDPAYDFEDIVDYLKGPTRTWNGTLYGSSIDGDMHHMIYRKDVFADGDLAAEWASAGGEGEFGPPQTWQQVQAYTQFFSGKEYEGQPLYGILDTIKPTGGFSAYFLFSRASAYAKHPNDPAFFFDLDMTPRINSPAFVRGLQDMVDATEVAPPDQQARGVAETFSQLLTGQGTMEHWWGDVGSNVYTNASSIVQGKLGYSILPGSPDVYNHQTKQWETLPELNRAPQLAYLGWGMYVMKAAEERGVAEAAWDLVSHLTGRDISLWMVIYPSGQNPWRTSHFNGVDWTLTGMPEAEAQEYLTSIQESYNHPNRIIDLRIPGAFQYYEALEAEVARAVAGEVEAQAALDAAAQRWNEITDTLDRPAQVELYQASLG